jgi:hypothetical protein
MDLKVSFSSYPRKDKTQNKFGTAASINPQVPNFGLFFFKGLVNLIFLGTKKSANVTRFQGKNF